MQKIAFLHGMSCYLNECFGKELMSNLEKSGKWKIITPLATLHPNITLKNWNDVLNSFLKELDEDTIYVCHSLGTNFILKFLFKNKLKAKAIFCVAGGYTKNPPIKNAYLKPFIPTKKEFDWAINNCALRINFFNKNDDIWTQKQILDYCDMLQAKKIELPYGGHFGKRSGVKNIPELEELIKETN